MNALPDLRTIARVLGGEVSGNEARVPGPGHGRTDRSLVVKVDAGAPDGFLVHSFSDDDPILCKDHIRSGLGMAPWQPGRGERGIKLHDVAVMRPRPKLTDVPLPNWTPPDGETGKPKFNFIGQPEPKDFGDEARRHRYRRDGRTVRVKVKRKDGNFTDWYATRRPSDGAEGWQAAKPEEWVPVPYLAPGAPDPFDPERQGEWVAWPEGEKDVDTLHAAGFLGFSFGGSSDVPDCSSLLEGRHIVIAADNDTAGEKCADKKVRAAFAAGAAAVKVVRFPELPKGGDVSDYFAAGGDAHDFLDRAERIEAPDAPEVIPPERGTPAVPPEPWAEDAIRDEKGRVVANLANAMLVLRSVPIVAECFSYDLMMAAPMLAKPLPAAVIENAEELMRPRPVRDTDVSQLQEWLQHAGLPRVSKDTAHQAVDLRAQERAYHPVRDYLDGLRWDGAPRLGSWLTTYLGAKATDYTAGIGRMFIVAMVARIVPRQSR